MSAVAVARMSDGLRNVHGRGMNTCSDVYKLPADAEEHDRLTLQHRIWKLLMGGGLYPTEVEGRIAELLSRKEGGEASQASVLDLGCGSGIWAIEMAETFPHTKVLGIDLAEPKIRIVPDNCRFLTVDATKGLDEYAETFDVVHCRCVAGHVIDRSRLLHIVAKVLKPGGLLLLGDGNCKTFLTDGTQLPEGGLSSDPASSWLCRWLSEVVGFMQKAQLDLDKSGGDQLGTLVQDESSLVLLERRAYYSCVLPELGISGSENFEEVDRMNEIARLTKQNMLDFLTSSKPILLSNGIQSSTVEDWQRRATSEITEPPMPWSLRWDLVWASKMI